MKVDQPVEHDRREDLKLNSTNPSRCERSEPATNTDHPEDTDNHQRDASGEGDPFDDPLECLTTSS
jgi:hypothetical protein